MARTGIFVLSILSTAAIMAATTPSRGDAEFTLPTPDSRPSRIVAGPDGALWFTQALGNKIGRITVDGVITEFPIPTANSYPVDIALGSDGALWFTQRDKNRIGRITTSGTITEFAVPTPMSAVTNIAAGPDGALWFTQTLGNKIGRITTSGVITEYPVPTPNSAPGAITPTMDGLWFSMEQAGKAGYIKTATGMIFEYPLPSIGSPNGIVIGPDDKPWIAAGGRLLQVTPFVVTQHQIGNAGPFGILAGPDGAIWYTDTSYNRIGRFEIGTKAHRIVDTTVEINVPSGIAVGPDGNIWITQAGANKISRIDVPPASSTILASVLPSSRSVQIGQTATAFATILNDGPAATICGFSPVTSIAGTFSFQTTHPSTNALTGMPNTRVSLPAFRAQTFALSFKATGPMAPTNVAVGFGCAERNGGVSAVGVNTVLMTFSPTPVPDLIAISATPAGDGILNLPAQQGTTAFGVATINIGSGDAVTVSADTVRVPDVTPWPVDLFVCQTDPASGACLANPAATVTATLDSNDISTFSVFARALGPVPFDPGNARIFVRFRDSNGVTRGSTSVAMRTQ